jgi:DNA-binding helix-hairpin-helix protein with protein kinase domain
LRKENHDNFGLAVIVFQLLFMGRHPFAGRYSGSGDMPIERAIQEYNFAFGAKASTKQMAPPPNTLDLSVCTSSIAQLFERAFSEEGNHKEIRPKPQEWVTQLEVLRNGLHSCNQNSVHKYHRSLSSCPWCRLENISGTVYFLNYTSTGATQSTFNLEDVWSKIQSIKVPLLGKLPDASSIVVTPTSLPEYAKPPTGFLGVVNFIFNFHDDGGERNRRESILRQAEQQWQNLERQWQALKSDSGFKSAYQSLQDSYSAYKDLPNKYQAERKSALLKIYLERYFIENAKISNIGKKRALVLASYGVETAADISYGKVASIPGFGQMLTQKLVDWRNTLEIRFQQYKSSSKDLAALNGIEQKYARKRSELESKLIGGKTQLEYSRNTLIKKREQVRKEAETAAKRLAQARADMKVYI